MPRLLYDTTTSTLRPYPRQDDDPVVGLDPRYLEMNVIQQEQPTYNPATEQFSPTEAIDLTARTVTRGWQVSLLPPPPPPVPDYIGFYGSLLTSDAYASVLRQSMASDSPALATLIAAFVSAISEAMAGRANVAVLQEAVWLLLGNATTDAAELQGLLVSHHLDGIYTLQPPTTPDMVRARNPDGTFIADNPATPENEAWVTP